MSYTWGMETLEGAKQNVALARRMLRSFAAIIPRSDIQYWMVIFCHAGRGHVAAGDATGHVPDILKRPPIPVVLALVYLSLLLGVAVFFVFITQR